MSQHVHSRAVCEGVAIIRCRVDGVEKEWPIAASTCPDNPSTPESIRAHFEHHRPGCEWVGVEILTMVEWSER